MQQSLRITDLEGVPCLSVRLVSCISVCLARAVSLSWQVLIEGGMGKLEKLLVSSQILAKQKLSLIIVSSQILH